MASAHRTDESAHASPGTDERLKRRGILAAAGAVMAGIVARQAAEPVAALHQPEDVGLNIDNISTGNTNIHGPGAPVPWTLNTVAIAPVFSVQNTSFANPDGIAAKVPGIGVALYGETVDGVGVRARATGAGPNAAIYADAVNDTTAIYASAFFGEGVFARSAFGTGLHAVTAGPYGVYATSAYATGVAGSSSGGTGVLGSTSGGGYGVLGQSVNGNGVRGYSQQNHAIVGQTARPYYGGVAGYATITNGVGIYGSTNDGTGNVGDAFAGYMDGNFVVANGVKSAAVKHTDGSHRLVYCMESPENWFEDFGEGKVVGGKAEVKIDPDFAAVVETGAYHVFLTPGGDCNGLYVTAKTATGFAVREVRGGAGNLSFSYRIVAKRKDIKAERLAKFNLIGKAKHDTKPPLLPPPPAVPSAPPERKP